MRFIRKRLCSILLVLSLAILFGACQGKKESVIHIAWLIESTNEINNVQEEADLHVTRINSYLQQQKKDYQIQIAVVSQQEMEEDLHGSKSYQLIYGDSYTMDFLKDSMDQYICDLSEELKTGDLQPLYNSMPMTYWDTLSQNGSIYNTVRSVLPAMHGLWIFTSAFEKLDIDVPEKLIGKPLEDWADFFAEVYEKNGRQPFLISPFWERRQGVVIGQGFVWEAHFHMIAEHMGISYDQPELGVQCVYESEYARMMNEVWKDYWEKGYVFTKYMEFTEARKNDQLVMRSNCCYTLEPTVIADQWMVYPLQDSTYSSNQSPPYFEKSLYVVKDAGNLHTVYQFLNDMANDVDFAANICKDPEKEQYLFLSPKAGIMTPMGGGSSLLTGVTEPVNENSSKLLRYYNQMQSGIMAGFVFDPSNVEVQLDQMWYLSHQIDENGEVNDWDQVSNNARESDHWEDYEEAMDVFIEQLYKTGMKNVLQEANDQLNMYLENKP